MYALLKNSTPLCCGFLHLFLVFVFGIINFLLRVGKFFRFCAFRLHHKVSISLCDDLLHICAY